MGRVHARIDDDYTSDSARRHDIAAILAGAFGILLVLALGSYAPNVDSNLVGPVGKQAAGSLIAALGIGAWLVFAESTLLAIALFRGQLADSTLVAVRAASMLATLLIACPLLHIVLPGIDVYGDTLAGGVLGEVTGEALRSLLGTTGSVIILVALLLCAVALRSPVSLRFLAGRGMALAGSGLGGARSWLADVFADALPSWQRPPKVRKPVRAGDDEDEDDDLDDEDDEDFDDDEDDDDDLDDEDDDFDEDDEEEASAAQIERAKKAAKSQKKHGPKIIAPVSTPERAKKATKESEAPKAAPPKAAEYGDFKLPPTTLLAEVPDQDVRIDEETLHENAKLLVEKLAAYGVQARVDEIHPGPVVTMYELEPASGTKVAKIANLADDLAMALAAQKVRIVAPIPGKARVGVEIPNERRQTVFLREILEDRRWERTNSSLPLAFGKDIAGQPIYGDLSRMPHMLVAGATGAGKSVGINVMLASLLSKKTPDDVRLLMIDPKVVELAVFDGIPHMLLPVVTDMKKAALALRWAVDEMERRYQLFADVGSRSILTYNERVEKLKTGKLHIDDFYLKRRKTKAAILNASGEEDADTQVDIPKEPTRLPHIVVVVDEFADMMMVAAKEVESAVARLAQKARAAGIHVILATQRPSVDVITGMIKANFPARIAFKVAQREDSKTILGRNGAEQLLGMGDMLMMLPGSGDLVRVHSAYVSEDEIKALCDYLREQGEPVYDESIIQPRDDDENVDGESASGPTEGGDLYDRAVRVVAEAGYCSISHIQRKLGIGYNRAANLVEKMEAEGVVGPAKAKAGGRRDVYISSL